MPGSGEEVLTTDRLDRQLVQALVIDGRASFRALAAVLGASEQTVARRYRRLREAGAVRVVVIPNPRIISHQWIVRARVRPSAAVSFAQVVARRDDVAWVGVLAGGTEVAFAVRATTRDQRDALLLERLPQANAVLDLTACAVLHTFADGPETEWRCPDDPLDPGQIAALVPDRRAGRARPTELDAALLRELAQDGRASYAALAAATADSESRVARRVEALLAGGGLIVDAEIAAGLLGYTTNAWLWLTVAPSALDAVAHEVSRHPEVPFTAAISGPSNLAVSVITRDDRALYTYLTERIGAIDAVRSVEVSPILRRFKGAGTLMQGVRLPHP